MLISLALLGTTPSSYGLSSLISSSPHSTPSPNSHQLALTKWEDTEIYIWDIPPDILPTVLPAQEVQPDVYIHVHIFICSCANILFQTSAAKNPRLVDLLNVCDQLFTHAALLNAIITVRRSTLGPCLLPITLSFDPARFSWTVNRRHLLSPPTGLRHGIQRMSRTDAPESRS